MRHNRLKANDFETTLPEGWSDRSMISLIRNEVKNGFSSNIVILREELSPNQSIESYAHEQARQIRSQIPDLNIIDERPTTVVGKPAYQFLQRFSSNGMLIQQAQTYILHKKTVFAVTCTALIDDFNEAIPAFREVVENLVFDEK